MKMNLIIDLIRKKQFARKKELRANFDLGVMKKESFLSESNFIRTQLSNCINMPIILEHKDSYNDYDIKKYLKNRIIGYNDKSFSIHEREVIYNEIFSKNDINIRKILLKLYGFNDKDIFIQGKNKLDTLRKNGYCTDWKLKDLGLFKKMFIELQYDYIKDTKKKL